MFKNLVLILILRELFNSPDHSYHLLLTPQFLAFYVYKHEIGLTVINI